MRSPLSAAVLFAALSAPLAAQQQGDHADHAATHEAKHDADHSVAGGGAVPAGWTVRADRGDAKNAKVVSMGEGLHLTLGPAIILYRAETKGTGPFHTLATFTQTKPSEHAEGYGLFAGGQGLDGAAQKYVYFLIRQDGSYLIKRREGDKTVDVSKGWTQHAAVKKPDAKGASTNLLEVDNKRDPSKVVFMVNGQEVYGTEAKAVNLNGSVGIRANHNLDLHVEGFDVHR